MSVVRRVERRPRRRRSPHSDRSTSPPRGGMDSHDLLEEQQAWELFKMSRILEGLPVSSRFMPYPAVRPALLLPQLAQTLLQSSSSSGGKTLRDSDRSRGGRGDRRGSKNDAEVLRVAGTSLPQTVAGAVAKRMRDGNSSVIDSAGAQASHQALKAIAIARTYLDENDLDICARVEFLENVNASASSQRGEGKSDVLRDVLRFHVEAHKLEPYKLSVKHPMKVASTSLPKSTAGALARDVREGTSCSVSALGADSCFQMLKAISLCRQMVAEDKFDISFQPFYVDPNSNVLECAIVRHRI